MNKQDSLDQQNSQQNQEDIETSQDSENLNQDETQNQKPSKKKKSSNQKPRQRKQNANNSNVLVTPQKSLEMDQDVNQSKKQSSEKLAKVVKAQKQQNSALKSNAMDYIFGNVNQQQKSVNLQNPQKSLSIQLSGNESAKSGDIRISNQKNPSQDLIQKGGVKSPQAKNSSVDLNKQRSTQSELKGPGGSFLKQNSGQAQSKGKDQVKSQQSDLDSRRNFFVQKLDEAIQTVLKDKDTDTVRNDQEKYAKVLEMDNENLKGKCGEIAKQIEDELYKLYKGDLGNFDYRQKYRSLIYNLKDPRNPDLRYNIISNTVPVDQLVRMSAQDLASQDVQQQRQKLEKNLAQQKFLDIETAAQFSTQAAFQLQQEKQKQKVFEEAKKQAGQRYESKDNQNQEKIKEQDQSNQENQEDTNNQDQEDKMDVDQESRRALNNQRSFNSQGSTPQPQNAPGSARKSFDSNQKLQIPTKPDLQQKQSSQNVTDIFADQGNIVVSYDARTRNEENLNDVEDDQNSDRTQSLELSDTEEMAGREVQQKSARYKDSRGVNEEQNRNLKRQISNEKVDDLQAHKRRKSDEVEYHLKSELPIQKYGPIILMQPYLNGGQETYEVNHEVWRGDMTIQEERALQCKIRYIGGSGDLKKMIPRQLEIKGRVPIKDMDKFFNDMSYSRSRTITIAVLTLQNIEDVDQKVMLDEIITDYQQRQKSGVMGVIDGVESFLLPNGLVARKLLESAKDSNLTFTQQEKRQNSFFDREQFNRKYDLDKYDLLLALVHKKEQAIPQINLQQQQMHKERIQNQLNQIQQTHQKSRTDISTNQNQQATSLQSSSHQMNSPSYLNESKGVIPQEIDEPSKRPDQSQSQHTQPPDQQAQQQPQQQGPQINKNYNSTNQLNQQQQISGNLPHDPRVGRPNQGSQPPPMQTQSQPQNQAILQQAASDQSHSDADLKGISELAKALGIGGLDFSKMLGISNDQSINQIQQIQSQSQSDQQHNSQVQHNTQNSQNLQPNTQNQSNTSQTPVNQLTSLLMNTLSNNQDIGNQSKQVNLGNMGQQKTSTPQKGDQPQVVLDLSNLTQQGIDINQIIQMLQSQYGDVSKNLVQSLIQSQNNPSVSSVPPQAPQSPHIRPPPIINQTPPLPPPRPGQAPIYPGQQYPPSSQFPTQGPGYQQNQPQRFQFQPPPGAVNYASQMQNQIPPPPLPPQPNPQNQYLVRPQNNPYNPQYNQKQGQKINLTSAQGEAIQLSVNPEDTQTDEYYETERTQYHPSGRGNHHHQYNRNRNRDYRGGRFQHGKHGAPRSWHRGQRDGGHKREEKGYHR